MWPEDGDSMFFQNAGIYQWVCTASQTRTLSNVAKFKYLGMTVTNKNCICEEIKSKLMQNVWYHTVQNLSSSQMFENVEFYVLLCMGVKFGLSC
jgi:hypothetical protein